MDTSFGSQAIDQNENNGRERQAARIAILPIDEQEVAIDAGVVRQRAYLPPLPRLIFDEAVVSRASPPSLKTRPAVHLKHIGHFQM
jgi:hypothetical protein